MAVENVKFKVILCGEYGSGKTSLFRRFIGASFEPNNDRIRSKGMDHSSRLFMHNGEQIMLELWDTGGLERFNTLSSSYYQSASAAVLCFALDNRESFNALPQHLLEVVVHTKTAKIFLCGNKSDVNPDEVQVTDDDLENFKFQCDSVISGTYKISCKTGTGLDVFLENIVEQLANSAGCKREHALLKLQYDESQSDAKRGRCCMMQ